MQILFIIACALVYLGIGAFISSIVEHYVNNVMPVKNYRWCNHISDDDCEETTIWIIIFFYPFIILLMFISFLWWMLIKLFELFINLFKK